MLFVDEIHRMSRPAEEMLYMAMEDFRVDVVIGKGPGATAIPLEIPPFTLVGATTRAGLLPGPLRDRFGFTAHLEFYEPADLDRIPSEAIDSFAGVGYFLDLAAIEPAITGKVELVYEGEQEGAQNVARSLVGRAINTIFKRYFPDPSDKKQGRAPYDTVLAWFAPYSGNARAPGPVAERGCGTSRMRCDACSQRLPCGMITHRIWAGFGKANASGDRPGETRNFPETEPVFCISVSRLSDGVAPTL